MNCCTTISSLVEYGFYTDLKLLSTVVLQMLLGQIVVGKLKLWDKKFPKWEYQKALKLNDHQLATQINWQDARNWPIQLAPFFSYFALCRDQLFLRIVIDRNEIIISMTALLGIH